MTADILTIPRAALHNQVTHRLRQMLVENQIAPGAKLNERTLCEALNISRTPLREAIKALAAEGLVALLPNRGAVAVALSEADVRNTFEVMAGLESQSGMLAAQRITGHKALHGLAQMADALVVNGMHLGKGSGRVGKAGGGDEGRQAGHAPIVPLEYGSEQKSGLE